VTTAFRQRWVQAHTDNYLATNGQNGHIWNGVPTILLTTTSPKSGKQITTPLTHRIYKESYVVVASNVRSQLNPSGFQNAIVEPIVPFQEEPLSFGGSSTLTGNPEHRRICTLMLLILPTHVGYQRPTKQQFPILILNKTCQP